MGILRACVLFLRAMLIPKAHLIVENLALWQQLAVLGQSVKRPKLRPRDRVFWIWLSRLWPNWPWQPPLRAVTGEHQILNTCRRARVRFVPNSPYSLLPPA